MATYRRDEGDGPDGGGVLDGEGEREDGAERVRDDVEGPDLVSLDDGALDHLDVLAERVERVGRLGAAAEPEQVHGEQPPPRTRLPAHVWEHRRRPEPRRRDEPVDEQHVLLRRAAVFNFSNGVTR
jgi:hypothetical protein